MDQLVDKIKIEKFIVYPIKSTHELELTESIVTSQGLMNDRVLIILKKKDNKFISIRSRPALYEIKSSFNNSKPELISIRVPGYEDEFHIDRTKTTFTDSDIVDTAVFSLPVKIYPVNNKPLDDALSAYLKEEVYVALPYRDRMLKDFKNPNQFTSEFKQTDSTNFADLSAILMTSVESLDYINELLKQKGHKPVEMICYRPNIVLSGIKREFWEDSADRIKIGDIMFRRVKGCTRCKLTTYDINEKKFRPTQEPLTTLTDVRYDDSLNGVVFGQHYQIDLDENGSNIITTNDQVTILK